MYNLWSCTRMNCSRDIVISLMFGSVELYDAEFLVHALKCASCSCTWSILNCKILLFAVSELPLYIEGREFSIEGNRFRLVRFREARFVPGSLH